MKNNLLKRVRDFDRQRPNVPGEHWLTLGGGVAAWLATRRHPSLAVRLLGSLAGTALVIRAVNGRDVPRPLDKLLPFSRKKRS